MLHRCPTAKLHSKSPSSGETARNWGSAAAVLIHVAVCLSSLGTCASRLNLCCRLIADRQAINLQLIGVLLPPVVLQPAGDAVMLQVLTIEGFN